MKLFGKRNVKDLEEGYFLESMLKYGLIITVLFAAVMIGLAPVDKIDSIVSVFWIIVFSLVSYAVSISMRQDYYSRYVVTVIVAFLSVAYLLKYSLVLHDPSLIWNAVSYTHLTLPTTPYV